MKKLRFISLFLFVLIFSISCKEDAKEYIHVGENWVALDTIKPSEKTFAVDIDVAESVVLGENLKFKVKSEQAGKLWILQVDPNDDISMIYPNELNKNNQIEAEIWNQIPAEGSGWSIEAMKPVGVSVIAFIVTDPNTDLTSIFNGQEKEMDKVLRLVENTPAWGLAKQVIDIKE